MNRRATWRMSNLEAVVFIVAVAAALLLAV